MIKDLTIGQYFPGNSIIHRSDPRFKIILLIVILILVFCAGNLFSLAFMVVFIFAILSISRVPIVMYLKNLKVILPIILLTTIINLFYITDGVPIFQFWVFRITSAGIHRSVFMSSRVILLILVSSVLTYTTSPNDLTDAIERLLAPLKYIGLGKLVHTLSMMMTIALRFIPTLIEETEKIMNAQKARGADFENGKIVDRIKSIIPILIPLLISSVRRAYDLAEAMECRCYNGGEGRQRMKQMHCTAIDYTLAAYVVGSLICLVLLNIIF